MNRSHTHTAHPLAPRHASRAHKDAIEWEEMPSLIAKMAPMDMSPAPRLMPRTPADEFNSAWGVTMPADLVATPEPAPFRETLEGLAMREVNEPELFAHFFGRRA